MNEVSTARGATAVEGYVVEEIKRHRSQARSADFVVRSETAIVSAETIEAATDKPIVELIELLVQRGLGTPRSPEHKLELDALIATESEKVGAELSDSLAHLVTAMVERSNRPIEARAGVPLGEYRFVWKAGEKYGLGDVTTDRGASWICIVPSADRPGKSAKWRLMDKGDIGTERKTHRGSVSL